jgi:hypothetical protein
MAKVKLAGRRIDLPKNRALRILIGIVLILFGVLGFLPVLGFWMIPLGLLVLSVDLPIVRRWRRHAEVRIGQWLKANYPSVAARLGCGNRRRHKHGHQAGRRPFGRG